MELNRSVDNLHSKVNTNVTDVWNKLKEPRSIDRFDNL